MYSQTIRTAASALRAGAVIAYPTEGVWGLGCDPSNPEAVLRILDIKQRPLHKGMILVADDLQRLAPFIARLPAADIIANTERPTTWLIDHGGFAPDWISGARPTLAIRISDHPIVAALCSQAEMPLVSTSANPTGKPPAKTALRVRTYFGNLIDIIVPGALGGQNGPSEIRDFATGKVLRPASTPGEISE